MSLEDKFKDVDGVGDATADELLSIINEHEFDQPPLVKKAIDAAEAGDDRQAAIFLQRSQQ